MKKIFISILIVLLITITVFASAPKDDVQTTVTDASYSISKYGELKASFYVKSGVPAMAIVSSFNEDGRLLSVRILPNVDGWCYASFSDYDEIDYIKINLFAGNSLSTPLCEQTVIYNTTETGDVSIPMFPIFG